MITQTEMMRVIKEELLDVPSTAELDSPEVAEFRRQYKNDVVKAKANGYELTVPCDWDDDEGKQT